MKFIDNNHKKFYEEKLNEIGTSDVYRKAFNSYATNNKIFNEIIQKYKSKPINNKDGEINE